MNILQQFYRWHKWRSTLRLFNKIKTSNTDHLVDCGANIGDYTEILSRKGGIVHAIEPNPAAFAILAERFRDKPQIKCISAAVHTSNGEAELYFHKNSNADPVKFSTGSSLLSNKSNIDKNLHTKVQTIDLSEFIRKLGRVRILKMDIEGAEVDIIEDLIKKGTDKLIDHFFIETHDHKMPELHKRTEQLRKLSRESRHQNLHLYWH